MELRIALQPKQKLFRESINTHYCTLFGGAKGGGKSHGLREIMLLRRFEFPGSDGAIFRKSYPELEANHIRPLFKQYPELKQYYNESKKILALPNRSNLLFRYLESEKDLPLHQGQEYHDLAIDEVGQWTETMFKTLQGSNRSSIPGVPARTLLTGNPGGIGHAWLKRIFVERRFNSNERPTDYNFIRALVDDNSALLDNDPTYVHRLESEPNMALRKAYRYGDWDIFAGQFFGEINREVHFIKPFAIPRHWNRFGAYDFGFNHPASFGWYAVDEDGNVFKYRELVRAQLRVDQFAQELKKFEDTERLERIVAGWDCWAQKGVVKTGTPPTVAEEFMNNGIILSRAVIDRIQGANQMRNYLAWQGRPGNKPRFYIFDTCPVTFETISRMQHDPDRVEDVLKQDASEGDPNSGDDAYDETRYALMSRPMIAESLPVRHKHGSKAWAEHTTKMMEEHLERDIQRQQSVDREADIFAISQLDPFDQTAVLNHYINKKRGA